MRLTIAVGIAGALVLGACDGADAGDTDVGGPPPGDVTTVPVGPALGASDLVATCGQIEFAELPVEVDSFPPIDEVAIDGLEVPPPPVPEDAPAAEDLQLEYDSFFPYYQWFVFEHADDEVMLFGHAIDPAGDIETEVDFPYGWARFERDETGRWEPRGWGDCQIEVSLPGWTSARFWVDPDVELDPESTTLSVQANAWTCASGEAPDEGDITSVVASEDDESVAVVVLVDSLGGEECANNLTFPYIIELGSELGDRTVLDASVDPPIDAHLAVPETSAASSSQSE